MALHLRPASPSDLPDIAALLREAFNPTTGSSLTDPRVLHWKYFDPVGSDTRPRSYVMVQNGTIVAHCCAAPGTLIVPSSRGSVEGGARLSSLCFMDWAARRGLPGVGISLMKRLMAGADVTVVAGGTDATRGIIPKLGYSLNQTMGLFARVIRPFRQARSRPSEGLMRDAARLIRNTAWSRTPLGPIPSEWHAERVTAFPTAAPPTSAWVHPERRADYLNYWLRCPAASIEGFEIRRGSAPMGGFMISRVAGQARVAAVWLSAAAEREWEYAYRLAARAAADDSATCEVICFASTPLAHSALEAAGFRWCDSRPLYVFDPRGLLASAPTLAWDAIGDDAAYVFDPSHPFRT